MFIQFVCKLCNFQSIHLKARQYTIVPNLHLFSQFGPNTGHSSSFRNEALRPNGYKSLVYGANKVHRISNIQWQSSNLQTIKFEKYWKQWNYALFGITLTVWFYYNVFSNNKNSFQISKIDNISIMHSQTIRLAPQISSNSIHHRVSGVKQMDKFTMSINQRSWNSQGGGQISSFWNVRGVTFL